MGQGLRRKEFGRECFQEELLALDALIVTVAERCAPPDEGKRLFAAGCCLASGKVNFCVLNAAGTLMLTPPRASVVALKPFKVNDGHVASLVANIPEKVCTTNGMPPNAMAEFILASPCPGIYPGVAHDRQHVNGLVVRGMWTHIMVSDRWSGESSASADPYAEERLSLARSKKLVHLSALKRAVQHLRGPPVPFSGTLS
ncbi:hypothetical protein QK292_13165 [Arthrobacter sp. AL08]|uniref:hypothetical protein n=1 Tax=unclassified Arthrobacter TaxID=235627 RepID=UPI00249ACCE3|nr:MULTISPECIES: hypothetical protein [unclassified Arthrobacter]MDI3242492.1 hypothetical protein [Arthrobacter sp. AL05]MDI3278512.1 hypothetical protein [Arthrobacter sp. AL08]